MTDPKDVEEALEFMRDGEGSNRSSAWAAQVLAAEVRRLRVPAPLAEARDAVVESAKQWKLALEKSRQKWDPDPIQLAGRKILEALDRLAAAERSAK